MRWVPGSLRPLIFSTSALGLLAACLVGPTGAVTHRAGARLVTADESRIVFEIDLGVYTLDPSRYLTGTEILTIPGFGSFSEPGQPLLPGRAYRVALPPQGGYSVSYRVQRSKPLGKHRLEPVPFPVVHEDGNGESFAGEEYRIDEAIYNGIPSNAHVAAQKEAWIRHQRVLPIRVTPVTYDPATGETVLATSIRIEVSMTRGERGLDPLQGREGTPVQESSVWRRIFNRILVNPEKASEWRVKTPGRSRDLARSARTAEAVTGPAVKLKVRDTGIHRVGAASVIAKGFPPGTQVADLHVFKRVYDPDALAETIVDIPFRVVEDTSGVAGEFDASDWLVFHGRRLREDETQMDPIEKFSDVNIYWLGASGGTEMITEDIPRGFVSTDTIVATFPVDQYYEEDHIFFEGTPPGQREFFFYDTEERTSVSIPFVTTWIDPSGTFQLKARFLGADRKQFDRLVKVSIINSKGTTQLLDALVPRKNSVEYESEVLTADVIDDGANTLRIDKTADRTTLEALIDYFTIEYRAFYRARDNMLEFNTGTLAGDTSITVTRLSGTDVMLFDVTDPFSTKEYRLTAEHFTNVGDSEVLSFRESLSSQKRFVLTHLDGIAEITGADVLADKPSQLIGSAAEGGVDILVVSHADFLGEMQRWVDYRRAQGYRVLMADVEDVFDEFNGGVPNARAVRNFINHFFETGGASFVVLVGDASEDNKQVHPESGENFVPTESYTEYVGGTFNKDEVVTTDKWYVILDYDFINDDPPGLRDFYPDLILGRLPVGSVAELRDVLDKIFTFEQPKGDDFWRRRILRVADNPFSGEPPELCYSPSEEKFQAAEEAAAQITEEAMPGGFDIVRLYLSNQINHPPFELGSCAPWSSLTNQTRSIATTALIEEMNAGACLVSIQAHMNRSQICHEWLFTSQGSFGVRDHLRLRNSDRPWIVFGMGCHMSDYAINRERALSGLNYPNGDSMAELLFLQKYGAVGTYASSGFEYLTPNKNYTPIIADAFFGMVPTDTMVASNKAQARWIFGENMIVAEFENLDQFDDVGSGEGGIGQLKRYHLLGDPVLRIEGGPPRFHVTVNGDTLNSGDEVFSGGGDDNIDVRAVVTDEVAVEELSLEIAGGDSTHLLTIEPLMDQNLTAARQYEVRFQHQLQARDYDIVLRAHQAEDTTAGNYHVVAEFVLKVRVVAELTVNGRPVMDGDLVPQKGDYVFTVDLPIYVDRSLIRVETDREVVAPIDFSHPTPQDSTTWLVSFSQELAAGPHTIVLFVDDAEFAYNVLVGVRAGLFDVIAYPNPFQDDVYFVFTNELQITDGRIDVFTTSGKKVAHLKIPSQARAPGQNAVRWDGRTFNGDEIANGVYLFVVSVNQAGQESTQRGKLFRAQ